MIVSVIDQWSEIGRESESDETTTDDVSTRSDDGRKRSDDERRKKKNYCSTSYSLDHDRSCVCLCQDPPLSPICSLMTHHSRRQQIRIQDRCETDDQLESHLCRRRLVWVVILMSVSLLGSLEKSRQEWKCRSWMDGTNSRCSDRLLHHHHLLLLLLSSLCSHVL